MWTKPLMPKRIKARKIKAKPKKVRGNPNRKSSPQPLAGHVPHAECKATRVSSAPNVAPRNPKATARGLVRNVVIRATRVSSVPSVAPRNPEKDSLLLTAALCAVSPGMLAAKQKKVLVSFVVDKDGSVAEVTVVKPVHKLFNDEAVRLIRKMPKWEPGMKDGSPVRCRYLLPVNFSL